MIGSSEHERTLLTRSAQGDRQAFADLAEQLQGPLFRYLRSLVRSDEVAEDALQEVLVGVWRGAGHYRGESSARAWVFSLARRQAARTWRRRVGEPADPLPIDGSDGSAPIEVLGQAAGFASDDPESLVSRAEDRHHLQSALERLSPADREVLVLRDVEGLTGPEAAEVLGVELAALKTRVHRARLRLMAELRAEGGSDAH
jgi:RNA polymerase sigma-70 factor, ECF subfamily